MRLIENETAITEPAQAEITPPAGNYAAVRFNAMKHGKETKRPIMRIEGRLSR